MYKIIPLSFALIFLFTAAMAENVISCSNVVGVTGKTATLKVNLNNTDKITALSFELTLPSNVSIVKNGSEYAVLLDSARKAAGATVVCGGPTNNTYIIGEYSTSNGSFTPGAGTIINITLNIGENATLGNNTITVSNVELTKTDLSAITSRGSTSTLTVKKINSTKTIGELTSVDVPHADDIPASGGQSRAEATVNYKYWTRTVYSDNSYSDASATTANMVIYGDYVKGNNLGTTVAERSKKGSSTPKGALPYNAADGSAITANAAACDVYQAANDIVSFGDVKLSLKNGQNSIQIPVGESFNLIDVIEATQDYAFASNAQGTANVTFFYDVIKSVEGFDPLMITDSSAIATAQATASPTLARDFTIRVLGLGEGNKVGVADVLFSAVKMHTSVSSLSASDSNAYGANYDLVGRMIPVTANNSARICIIGGKKVVKK